MDVIPGGSQGDGALVIVLEGWTVAVIRVAVSFDDDSVGRPKEIDEVVLHQNVDLGQWQAKLATKDQKVDLQWRACIGSTWIDFNRHAAQASDPLLSSAVGEQTLELGPIAPSTSIGGHERSLGLFSVKASGHIEQGSLDRGDRNSLLLSNVALGK